MRYFCNTLLKNFNKTILRVFVSLATNYKISNANESSLCIIFYKVINMFSKFLKFTTKVSMIALLSLSAKNANAEIARGMTFGIGGEWMAGIDKNHHFSFESQTHSHQGNDHHHDDYTLHMRKDQGFGGSLSIGYLMENGFEAGLEVLYKELKYRDHTIHDGHLETHNLIGLLKGTYYIDLGSMIYPYMTAGIGIAHIRAEGVVYNDDPVQASTPGARQFVKFDHMHSNKLAGDAGFGLAFAMQEALLSLGVKISGNHHMSGSHHYHDINITDGIRNHFRDNEDFDFGKLSQVNYSVEAKLKIITG